MAGPYTGSWRANAVSQEQYTGASKWGTGVNPVHSNATMGPFARGEGTKLNIDPIQTPGGDESYGYIAEDQAWAFNSDNPDPNLPPYDTTPMDLYGNNEQTGTADRPVWGSGMGDASSNEMGWGLPNPDPGPPVNISQRAKTQNATRDSFPPWGGSRKTAPLGTRIRALMRGNDMIVKMRVLPNEDVAQGWINKADNAGLGQPGDSRPSDDSQIFIQTSDVQRYKTREGSQNIGSQSTYNSPVQSRVRNQKVKVYASTESARHWDMLPYEQEDFPRPFLSRQAGTGYPYWQLTNEMYVSPAIQREPPADPSLGGIASMPVDTTDYGYSYEDGQYY